MYKKVPTNLDFVSRERETLEFWKENKVQRLLHIRQKQWLFPLEFREIIVSEVK